MSDRLLESRSAVAGPERIRRRLDDLERRLEVIHEEMAANQREFEELRRREGLVLAEHAEYRSRFNALVAEDDW